MTKYTYPVQTELDFDTTILSSSMANTYIYSTPTSSLGNVTINTSNTGYNGAWLQSNGSGYANTWVTASSPSEGILEVKGENADVKINGKSLVKFMETMESRLAILQPDLEKLEHFAALKKAYDNYKMLEALCELPKKDENT